MIYIPTHSLRIRIPIHFRGGVQMLLALSSTFLFEIATAAEWERTLEPAAFSVNETETLSAKVMSDGKEYSVTSSDKAQTVAIELGTVEVKPETAYICQFEITGTATSPAAEVSLMIREKAVPDGAAFKPYHRTSLSQRPLLAGESSVRQLRILTGAESHAFSAVIVVTGLEGELRFTRFGLSVDESARRILTDAEAVADGLKVMAEVRAAADARTPLVPRSLVFSRSQMKYPLGRNYYHEWNDRPLLVSRAYRVGSNYPTPLESYRRTLEEVAEYGIDGLAFFPETVRRLRMFEAHTEAGIKGVGLLPEFLPGDDAAAITAKTEILRKALANPAAPRINGKILVTSYAAESLSPEGWNDVLTQLRENVGDSFLFLPSLTNVVGLRKSYLEGKPVSRTEVEAEQAVLRSYLDVCDGIYFNYPAAFRQTDHTFDGEFYRNIFIPVFKSVLSEPNYREKLLGLSAYKSHMSPERSNSLHEDGTRTLRRSFEAAMNASPDVIILPEWDEVNENTNFRPTVYGSRTSGRIIRYYMSQLKGGKPSPYPGDNTNVPNLILSTRKSVVLGQVAEFELLNVPDGGDEKHYSVALNLENADGQVAHSFPSVKFDSTELKEHRFTLATENFPDTVALIPTLRIKGFGEEPLEYREGFHHVQIRATWNWDDLFVKQPLRDLLRPASAIVVLEGRENAEASLILRGSAVSPEELNLIEVLGDDDEVYTYDAKDEFFRNAPDKDLLLVEFRSQNNLRIKGNVTLENATADWFTNGAPLIQQEADEGSQRISFDRPVSIHQRWIYLAVPKTKIAKGRLAFDFDLAKFSVPLKDVFEKSMIARAFENGLHISVRPYRRQIDMPSPAEAKEVSFQVNLWPEIATEQYHLRLTTVSGKTYRSRPVIMSKAKTSEASDKTKLRIHSDTSKGPINLEVKKNRVPELRYEFDPSRGAVLLTDAGRPFWGSLGGFTNSTTGRGTINNLFGEKYPSDVARSAPAWVTDNGSHCLEFDGVGTYLELPREAIPRHGAFTLDVEIKPDTPEDQTLLINGVIGRQTGLTLRIEDGKLHASFLNSDWTRQPFSTQLNIPPAEWSMIRVRSDFENLSLSVNGKTESFPQPLPAANLGFTVIGANWKGKAYSGRLRRLVITHNALP